MKIAVCLKQVPSTDTRIKIAADGKHIDPAGVTFVSNPYDEFALEEAIRIKEARGFLKAEGDDVPADQGG